MKSQNIFLLMDGHDDVSAYKTFEMARDAAAIRYRSITSNDGKNMEGVFHRCKSIPQFNRVSDDNQCEAYIREVAVE